MSILISIFIYIFYQNKDIWALFLLSLFIIFIIKKPWHLFFGFIIGFSMIFASWVLSPNHPKRVNGNYRVKDILSSGLVIEDHNTKILLNTKINVKFNDLIHVTGLVKRPENFSDFDYISYLKTKNIENIISYPSIDIIGVSGDIRGLAREYFSTGPQDYKDIAPLIIIGEKTKYSKPFYDLSIKLSIVHLFVISGFHISLFYIIVNKIFKLLRVSNKVSSWLGIFLISLYLFILNFPISACRAALLTLLVFINKQYLKSKYSSLQILSFVMAIFSVYHPYVVRSLSFIFTFVATGTILFLNGLSIKNKFIKSTIIIIGVYISTIWIAISINGYLSLFGILYGVILTPIFSFLFSISIFLFPFKDLMSYIYLTFKQLLYALNSFNIIIDLPGFSRDIAKVIYLLSFSCFIIIKIWNFSMVKKAI